MSTTRQYAAVGSRAPFAAITLPSIDPDDYRDAESASIAIRDLANNAVLHADDLAALARSRPHVEMLAREVVKLEHRVVLAEQQVELVQRQLAVAQGVAAALIEASERRLDRAFDKACIAITRESFEAVNERLDDTTHVVDVYGLDGPPPDRTPTLRDLEPIAVGGGR